jgi:eukaryotic-like serine/threonine-protein kinase
VWQAIQADRFNKLRLGVRVLANDPYFKAALSERDVPTTLDSLQERGRDLDADFMVATDWDGVVVARTDRPGGSGEDLSADPIIDGALAGEESATLWRQGDGLSTAVAVPMQTGPELVGVLVAGYVIDEGVAAQIRRLTHSEIAYVLDADDGPRLAVSSLGPRESALVPRLREPGMRGRGDEPFEVDLDNERFIGVGMPLLTATGDRIGTALALRSLSAETAAFRQFRNSLVLVSLGVMVLALGFAYLAASRITGPVRTLVGLVDRAREGSFTGAVSVPSRDEIGVLARAFNGLIADLREKDEMIHFLREGMSALHQATPLATAATVAALADGETLRSDAPTAPSSSRTTAVLGRGEIFADRYEVLGTVGRGGMGVVYRARDRQLDEVVALKLLRPEALARDSSLLDRFKQEIKLARRITHHNVLRTHDFGETGGVPYISMEYLEGVTLKELIRSRGALPLGVGLSIAKQMCRGLDAAHAGGVVHRDIKPQNMLILPESAELKVMDFGISRVSTVDETAASDSGLTVAGTVMGTPDYMSPEQAQGRTAGFPSDVYSLGVVLFEMFTGRLPFTADSPMAVAMAHVQSPPPAPRSVNPGLPADLDAAILRCLEKEPGKRWSSVADLLEALGRVSVRSDAA